MPETKIKKLLLPAGLAVGGIAAGALFVPIGLASAQSEADSDVADSTEADADAPSDDRSQDSGDDSREGMHHRGGRFGKGLHFGGEALTETLNLSPEELRSALAENQSLADIAAAQGVDVETVTQVLTDDANERIDAALAEGKIDEERASELKDDVAERVESMITTTPEEFRAEREALRGERREGRQERRAEMTATLEEILGLGADEIREALESGTTLSDLASQQGIAQADLIQALVADATARVDEAVAEGKIDEDRAAQLTEGIEDRIEDLVEDGFPERGEGKGRHGRRT